ncbi:uncharacterized protein BO80DRAFT_479692 [Aspergillus ibericus CBS 121593]|uniref:Uncharacterized protein n=1 Tax=Aspergillus ibericus CBS 121593 TaxID=1448316 RepID=A0A395GSV4_9EURO|nr:hypothetical protein BO80DRAFT_479692 [Aspergillus ibericus CBS 121593]RAK98496.1 hypothetical protein BO80DRAFT_479692 [Aspergillus ibericus CBS 121593]
MYAHRTATRLIKETSTLIAWDLRQVNGIRLNPDRVGNATCSRMGDPITHSVVFHTFRDRQRRPAGPHTDAYIPIH